MKGQWTCDKTEKTQQEIEYFQYELGVDLTGASMGGGFRSRNAFILINILIVFWVYSSDIGLRNLKQHNSC